MIDLTRHRADQPAVIHNGQTWSYGELHRRSLRIARNLASAGIEPGDRVATLLPNSHELVALYLASFHGGFTIVPLDARYHSAQISFALRHSGASAVVTTPDRLEDASMCEGGRDVDLFYVTGTDTPPGAIRMFRSLLRTRPTAELREDFRDDDVSVVFYTSGTTARPKGVTLTRTAIGSSISKANALLRLGAHDVTLIAAPISRPMALRTQLLTSLDAGAMVVLLSGFDPDSYLQTLADHSNVTFLALLPAALRTIMFRPDLNTEHLSKLRLAICGGDYVPMDLFEKFAELTGLELTEQCGMTETGMYAINPPYGRKKRGAIGLPYYGAQVTIIDSRGRDVPWGESGEIAVRSPFAMDGYWNDTAATRRVIRDGWIRTGDVGRIDEDGFLWLDGRKKDIIVRGGSNISPAAIEAVLQQHPSVKDACVVGVDDAQLGQVASAFVTLCGDADLDEIESALESLAAHELPDYMVPQSICVLPKLPRTGSGKVDRERLKWVADSSDDETLAILLD
ncbi:MAG: class I adenylate-forming enzyme family protein [Planctomycetota bacterium]|jgi:acyl-CoA synthetase (AMP-forming)/AMP-acid ligase II